MNFLYVGLFVRKII